MIICVVLLDEGTAATTSFFFKLLTGPCNVTNVHQIVQTTRVETDFTALPNIITSIQIAFILLSIYQYHVL
jgi:hypothetical protein